MTAQVACKIEPDPSAEPVVAAMTENVTEPLQHGAGSEPDRPDDERPLRQSLWRGWRCKCPNCGAGPMLKGYLKVRPECIVCGEELKHHRADDGPAYLTILLVGHLIAPILMIAYVNWQPDPLILASALTVGSVGLSLYLLPRLKGLIVAVQWAKRMHGFGEAPAD